MLRRSRKKKTEGGEALFLSVKKYSVEINNLPYVLVAREIRGRGLQVYTLHLDAPKKDKRN